MLKFKQWIIKEGKDIFGFDSVNQEAEQETKDSQNPINSIDFEMLSEYLCRVNIGNRVPFQKFINEIYWGFESGALRLNIGTDLHIELDRMNYDLQGNPTWINKKIFQLDRTGHGGLEQAISQDILEQLKQINQTPIDSPKAECELEDLAVDVALKLRRTAKDLFLFQGIMKVDENDYIVRFSVGDQGVESPDHKRVIENQTRLIFRPERGIIEAWNYNIETGVSGHNWQAMQNDLAVNFFPTQSTDEIAEALATYLRWY